MSDTPNPRPRSRAGRKPDHPGGRRTMMARATLNPPEREIHERWLRSKGWPERPEVDIVRTELEAAWQRDGALDSAGQKAA